MAVKKETHTIPQDKMDAYKKLIATHSEIELKGATIPYTSFNGHMFSYFEKDGTFGLRLPDGPRDAFIKKYNTTLFVSYGIVKKEFVLVPDTLLKNFKAFKPYFNASLNYVKSLKAK